MGSDAPLDGDDTTLRGHRVNDVDTRGPWEDLRQAGLHPLEYRQILLHRQLVLQGQPLATGGVVLDPTPEVQLEVHAQTITRRKCHQISHHASLSRGRFPRNSMRDSVRTQSGVRP